MPILILYASTDQQTKKIANVLKQHLEERYRVTVCDFDAFEGDLMCFDRVVLGSRVRYSDYSKALYRFIKAHRDYFQSHPYTFFSVDLLSVNPHYRRVETNENLQRFLKKVAIPPQQIGVFAGKVDYRQYDFFHRWLMKLIVSFNPDIHVSGEVTEFTDWEEVEQFSKKIGVESEK